MTAKTQIITITDPKDYRNGDRFRGTSRNYKNSGAVVTVDNTLVGGSETAGGAYRHKDLYVRGNAHLPFVYIQSREQLHADGEGWWEDVTVTREVEEPDLPSKQGIWLHHSYGLDEDGDLSQFPNLILHLSNDPEEGWYCVTNATADKIPLTTADVRRNLGKMAPLTLKEVDQ